MKNLSVAAVSLDDLMKEVSSVARPLNNVVTEVQRAEGTSGAINNDPSVYEDVKAILGGAKRSRSIKRLIRHTIKKKKEEAIGKADK